MIHRHDDVNSDAPEKPKGNLDQDLSKTEGTKSSPATTQLSEDVMLVQYELENLKRQEDTM